MESGTEILLGELAIKKNIFRPTERDNAPNSEMTAQLINEKLGIKCSWTSEGNITTDRTPERNTVIARTIEETKEAVEHEIQTSLKLEAAMVKATMDVDVQFDTFDDYLQYAFESGTVKPNFQLDEQATIALKDGFLDHWRTTAKQIINDRNMEKVTWERFIAEKFCRRTLWNTATFLEQGQMGGWQNRRLKGISTNSLADKEYFPSNWLTHTTDIATADAIVEDGELNSDDINLGSSKVVWRQGAKEFDGITFLFDAREVQSSVPLTHGDYVFEGEIKSHYPIPIQLARAVVPTKILRSQQTERHTSDGWISQDINPVQVN